MAAKRARGGPDPRQTSFVVSKVDVYAQLDEERDMLLQRLRQASRRGDTEMAERAAGALVAIASIRDRVEKLA